MADETIYILDQITAKPGAGRAFLDTYMARYAPGARERGMSLVHTWVTPPVWLEDQSNTLFFVWSVQGADKVWASLITPRRSNEVEDWWWKEAADQIVTRQRSFLSDPKDIVSLTRV